MSDNSAKLSSHEPRATHNSALKILVCYHKPYIMPPNDEGIFLPIQGGKAISNIDLHMQGDNEVNGQPCDNISSKNPNLNELTVIYWAWKNLKTLYPYVKYIGLSHYRRFFAFNKHKLFETYIYEPEDALLTYSVDPEKVLKILESGRIILVKRRVFPYTVAAQYCMCHVSDNYRTVKKIILEKFPDYAPSFDEVMERNNKFSAYNMFIMKWEDFEKYCEWLFTITFAFVNSMDLQFYNSYQKRAPAFMAERLLNVYVHKNKIRTKYLNICYYDGEPKRRSALREFMTSMRLCKHLCQRNIAMTILNFNLNPIRRLLKKVMRGD